MRDGKTPDDNIAAFTAEPSEVTQVEVTPPCQRCGSHVGIGVTHVCPMPSTTSVIAPGSVVLTPWGTWSRTVTA